MLDYNTIEYKGLLSREVNGENVTHIDLLSQVINPDCNVSVSTMLIVNEYYVARPDLRSMAVYGTDKYADVLCKVNGISNPFELNEDMLIICPTRESIDRMFAYGKLNGGSELAKDGSRIAKSENGVKLKSDTRSPNEATVGTKNYVIDKTLGIVFY